LSFENGVGFLFSRGPNSDAGILAGGYVATVLKDRDGIHRAFMYAKYLIGGLAPERPSDRGGVETGREGCCAIGRDRKRTYGTAMPAQLRFGRRKTERRPDQHGATDQRD
jgi:hypothetical protein